MMSVWPHMAVWYFVSLLMVRYGHSVVEDRWFTSLLVWLLNSSCSEPPPVSWETDQLYQHTSTKQGDSLTLTLNVSPISSDPLSPCEVTHKPPVTDSEPHTALHSDMAVCQAVCPYVHLAGTTQGLCPQWPDEFLIEEYFGSITYAIVYMFIWGHYYFVGWIGSVWAWRVRLVWVREFVLKIQKLKIMKPANSAISCFFSCGSRDSSVDLSVCWSAAVVQTQISQQLFDGLPLNFMTVIVPREWIWLRSGVSGFSSVKYDSLYPGTVHLVVSLFSLVSPQSSQRCFVICLQKFGSSLQNWHKGCANGADTQGLSAPGRASVLPEPNMLAVAQVAEQVVHYSWGWCLMMCPWAQGCRTSNCQCACKQLIQVHSPFSIHLMNVILHVS